MTALVASPLGLLVGLALGALGGGGSVLAVPALVYVVGQSPQAATVTSLVVVALTSLGGLVGHHRAGHVRLGAGLAFGLAGVAGSVAGSRLNALLPADVLLLAFAALMVVAGMAMFGRQGHHEPLRPSPVTTAPAPRPGRGPQPTRGAGVPGDDGTATAAVGDGARTATLDRPGTVTAGSRTATVARVLLAGSVVGLLTGLFGVGGGFVVVPALVLALRFPMPTAIGTSLLVIALNATTALATRLAAGGAVDWAVALPFTLAGLVGVVAGTAIANRVAPDRLARVFAVLLVVVALAMGADALLD